MIINLLLRPAMFINIKKRPAVTNVEECTSDEVGVGAAIAIGSHAEKGNWADLVKQVIISNNKYILNDLWLKQ